jgi:hypothetical protein
MTVGETGSFEYHANPSTRPFVQSRKANVLGEPKDTLSTTGQAPAFGSSDTVFDVKADAGVLSATLTHTVPSGDDIIRNMDLVLLDAEGNELARTNEFAQVSVLTWAGKEGAGVPAGKYILRVKNTVGVVPSYSLEALTADIVPQHTARQFELWTMSCVTEQGVVGQQGVAVERGESVDVGDVCNAGVGGTDGGTDGKDKDKNKKPKKRDA